MRDTKVNLLRVKLKNASLDRRRRKLFSNKFLLQQASAGFSLLELMVVLAVIVMLVNFSFAPLASYWNKVLLSNRQQDFVAAFFHARNWALQQQRSVIWCAIAGRNDATGQSPVPHKCLGQNQWATGWMMWVDRNANDQLDVDEPSLVSHPWRHEGWSLTSNSVVFPWQIRINELGHSSTRATFTLIAPDGKKGLICLGSGARIRIVETTCS